MNNGVLQEIEKEWHNQIGLVAQKRLVKESDEESF